MFKKVSFYLKNYNLIINVCFCIYFDHQLINFNELYVWHPSCNFLIHVGLPHNVQKRQMKWGEKYCQFPDF